MPTPPSIAEHLRAIAKAIEPLGVRWYVFGAQAVIAAGVVRETADIDITTEDVPPKALQAALASAGFVLRQGIADLADLIEHHRILPLQHRKTGMLLDVVRAGPGPEEELLARAILRRVGRRLIPFVETNDLLVLKILAGREKDLEDVRALLRTRSPEIDPAVARARLKELGRLLDDFDLVRLLDEQIAATRRPPGRSRRRAR